MNKDQHKKIKCYDEGELMFPFEIKGLQKMKKNKWTSTIQHKQ